MKRALVVLTFLVTFVVGIPVMVLLKDALGPTAVTLAAIVCGWLGVWLGTHTPESAAFADDFKAALRDCDIPHKVAAAVMGISEPTLSNQLNGKEQLSAYRMASLGPAFTAALAKRQLARAGGYTVVEEGARSALLGALREMVGQEHQKVA
jgi:DNA-binding transcriptional regulator YdaS (Cro superfamily)